MNTHITDTQVDAACAKLRKMIEAAEASNQAGEDAVVRAAAAPDMLAALHNALAVLVGVSDSTMALDIEGAVNIVHAAITKAEGKST